MSAFKVDSAMLGRGGRFLDFARVRERKTFSRLIRAAAVGLAVSSPSR